MTETIKDWKIKRSGRNMTVFGYGHDNETRRVTHIESVEVTAEGIFATGENGTRHRLAASDAEDDQ